MKRYHDLSADVELGMLQYATSTWFVQTVVSRSGAEGRGTPYLRHAKEDRGKPVEPTSGLEPLTCSLRVIIHVLQRFAEACKTRISRLVSFLRLAGCCTVLRSRWCQSGVRLACS
jgi:hypothetical protein